MKSQIEGSIQQTEMLEFLREYSDQFPEILRRASAHLDRVFGLNLRVLDLKADTQPNQQTGILQTNDWITESLDKRKGRSAKP